MVADAAAVDSLGTREGCVGLSRESITGRESKVKDLGLMESSSQGICLAQRDSMLLGFAER